MLNGIRPLDCKERRLQLRSGAPRTVIGKESHRQEQAIWRAQARRMVETLLSQQAQSLPCNGQSPRRPVLDGHSSKGRQPRTTVHIPRAQVQAQNGRRGQGTRPAQRLQQWRQQQRKQRPLRIETTQTKHRRRHEQSCVRCLSEAFIFSTPCKIENWKEMNFF